MHSWDGQYLPPLPCFLHVCRLFPKFMNTFQIMLKASFAKNKRMKHLILVTSKFPPSSLQDKGLNCNRRLPFQGDPWLSAVMFAIKKTQNAKDWSNMLQNRPSQSLTIYYLLKQAFSSSLLRFVGKTVFPQVSRVKVVWVIFSAACKMVKKQEAILSLCICQSTPVNQLKKQSRGLKF